MGKQNDYFLLQGTFLISLLFFSLVITTILFLFGISISKLNLLLSVICSASIIFYFSNKSIKKTVIIVGVGIFILICCIFICNHAYDDSWDGNAYRKSMVGLLKYGWNPLTETFYTFADNNFPFVKVKATWFDAYPKGTEIFGASVYSVTQNIEAGKCFNILAAIALFCICFTFLNETRKIKKWQSLYCALFLAVNPVVLSQCLTYYNDGFLAQILLLCCVSLLYLTFYKDGVYKYLCWYFVFISINIGFNTKFSAIIFFAILCLSFFGYWMYKIIRKNNFNKNVIKCLEKPFLLFVISVVVGTAFTGATSYVVNIIRYKNPIYTMIGEGSTEMITSQLPTGFKNMSNLMRFVGSLFSRTNTSKVIENIEWKIPLAFNGNEFLSAQDYAVRTGGWGILFSGILLISLFILISYLIKNKHISIKLREITTLLLSVFILTVCVVPGLSWARYCVVIFWIPIGALLYIFIDSNYQRSIKQEWVFIAGIVSILLFVNVIPNMEKNVNILCDYETTHTQLERFKIITENNEVIVGQGKVGNGSYNFYGRFFNLYDMGIHKFVHGNVSPNNSVGSLFANYHIYYDVVDGIVSTENLRDFFSYLEEYDEYLLLVAVKDEASKALKEETIQQMRNFGLEFNLKDHYRWAYLAVIDEGKVIYEDMDEDTLVLDMDIDNMKLFVKSAGYLKENCASIVINDVEYAMNKRGLNIVLYDKKSGNVIDSICIDTFNDNSLTRNL